MKTKLILVAFNCLALSIFASPETHRAKAEELYRLNNNNMDIAKQLEVKMGEAAKRMTGKGIPPEAAQEIQDVVRKYAAKHVNPAQVEAQIINRLVAKFTEEETIRLIEIVKDPLLQRLKDELGTLKKEIMTEIDASLKADSEEFMQELKAIVVKYKRK